MAVILEIVSNRHYIGLAGDTKPTTSSTDTVPPASTFLETDTGRTWRWDGTNWLQVSADVVVLLSLLDYQQKVFSVLRDLRLEATATRLALQEWINEGNLTQHDFLEMAQTVRDGAETEEP